MAPVNQNDNGFIECIGANHQTDQQQHFLQTKHSTKRRKMFWHYCAFVIFMFVLPNMTAGQFFSTRDPRYYNREGDFHYRWPNPGDPDYR